MNTADTSCCSQRKTSERRKTYSPNHSTTLSPMKISKQNYIFASPSPIKGIYLSCFCVDILTRQICHQHGQYLPTAYDRLQLYIPRRVKLGQTKEFTVHRSQFISSHHLDTHRLHTINHGLVPHYVRLPYRLLSLSNGLNDDNH